MLPAALYLKEAKRFSQKENDTRRKERYAGGNEKKQDKIEIQIV